MKCSKRSFAIVSLLFAALLSSSIGTLNARDADLAFSYLRGGPDSQTAMYRRLSCTTETVVV
jgi:hypothetical protein